jgi:hypothetical protein
MLGAFSYENPSEEKVQASPLLCEGLLDWSDLLRWPEGRLP